jgi:Lrp/AsnC family leucine-responsive transcriptional regulator
MPAPDQFDKVDREILKLLLKDGRVPAAQIAEQVGLSRPAVAERIEKLEREGVIRGTTVVIDPTAVRKGVTAFIFARKNGPLDAKAWRAFRSLVSCEEILEAHSVAGDDCYLLKVRTDSISSLNEIVNRLGAAPLSLTTRTTIVMESHCEKVGGIAMWGARG